MHFRLTYFISLFILFLTSNSFASQKDFAMLLPDVIYGIPGIEMNVYFDNLVPDDTSNYEITVDCPRGMHMSDRWTFIPTEADMNVFTLSITFENKQTKAKKKAASTIVVSPKNRGAGKKISLLIIGDSLTHAGIYPDHLYELCKSQNGPELLFIGNNKSGAYPDIVRFEGYGGWTAERFATSFSDSLPPGTFGNFRSPFVYKDANGSTGLDFARYCKEYNSGNSIDVVLIFLGCNDVFDANDKNIENKIEYMLKYYEKLIEMVHQYSNKTKIGLLMPLPPASSQDSFGYNYNCRQTRIQYKRNQSHLVAYILKKYQKKQKEDNIFIVPTHLNIDTCHSYPVREENVNSQTCEKIIRQVNGVHPDKTGYYQIGDTVFSWLKSLIE
jgi:lysophospholipase L1-like esterase